MFPGLFRGVLLACLCGVLACAPPAQSDAVADAASGATDALAADLFVASKDVPVAADDSAASDVATDAPLDAQPDAATDAAADVATDAAVGNDALADALSDAADSGADVADAGTDADVDALSDVLPDATSADCGAAPKLCPTDFSYTGDGSELSVELRGSFNGWKTGIPMIASGTDWSVSAAMPYGQSVEYKFHIQKVGGDTWLVDPNNPSKVTDNNGNSNSLLSAQTCDPWTCGKLQTVCGIDAKATAFDWRDGVMYFVFVDRFIDGDPTNNGSVTGVAPIAGWNGGDWAGVTKQINAGYFNDLGVNVLWLTVPLDPTDALEYGDDSQKYSGYHGYWPRDRDKPNAHFGTMAELQGLVQAAHSQGIQIVLDYAMNHVHASSPVWTAHQNDGWFHAAKVSGQDCTCGSGVCPWDGPSMVYCWFTTYLPDFNFLNVDARKASIDNVIWWLQQSGADGLRLDAIKHVEGAWLTDLRARLLTDVEPQRQQHIWLVGETFSGDQTFVKTFVDPCTKLDGQFDFAERATLDGTILLRQGKMQDLETFLNGNDGFFGPDAIMSTFIGNHDLPRSIHMAQDTPVWGDVWANGKDKAWNSQPIQPSGTSAYERMSVAMAVLMTNRGVPLIYYGDEVGLAGAGDPDNRRPMQWTGYNAGQNLLLTRMKALGQARKNHAALRKGTRKTLWITQDAWLYQMTSGQDTVLVAINRADASASLGGLPAGTWQDLMGGADAAGTTVDVAARGVRVLVKK
jgi:glycosidase